LNHFRNFQPSIYWPQTVTVKNAPSTLTFTLNTEGLRSNAPFEDFDVNGEISTIYHGMSGLFESLFQMTDGEFDYGVI
jgi:hypothetical protein